MVASSSSQSDTRKCVGHKTSSRKRDSRIETPPGLQATKRKNACTTSHSGLVRVLPMNTGGRRLRQALIYNVFSFKCVGSTMGQNIPFPQMLAAQDAIHVSEGPCHRKGQLLYPLCPLQSRPPSFTDIPVSSCSRGSWAESRTSNQCSGWGTRSLTIKK